MAKKPRKHVKDLWNMSKRNIPKGSVKELQEKFRSELTAGPVRLPATKR